MNVLFFPSCDDDNDNEDDDDNSDDVSKQTFERDYSGVVHAKKYRIIQVKDHEDKQTLSDYDNINHEHRSAETKINSNEDIVSLNLRMTSSSTSGRVEHNSLTFTGESADQQELNKQNDDQDDDDDDEQVNEEDQLIIMDETSDFRDDEQDEYLSDHSQASDDFK